MRTIFIGLAALAVSLSFTAKATEYAPQFWKNDQEGWVVQARECSGKLCAFLVSFKLNRQHPPGYVARDEKNPDPALRDRPLCGLQLTGDFKPERRFGDFSGGWVYDPDSGKTYSGTITQIDAMTSKLRAYIGLSLFGKTMTLRRLPDTFPEVCAPPAAG